MAFFNFNKKIKQAEADNLLACMPGTLILEQQAADLLQQIRDLISAPSEEYKSLYFSTLSAFAEFCQSMPWDVSDELYSLLRKQLQLCIAALKIRRGILLPKELDVEVIAQQEPQWTYAVFSACLFYQINKVQEDRKVILYDSQGAMIGTWCPLAGSIYNANVCYEIDWNNKPTFIIDDLIAVLLIRIIPPNVFKWISRNDLLMSQWWNAVVNDEENPISNIVKEAAKIIKFNKESFTNISVVTNTKLDELRNLNDNQHGSVNNSLYTINSIMCALAEKNNLNENKLAWLRLAQGLFVNINNINDYISDNEVKKSIEEFIESIKNYLVEVEGKYLIQYRSKNFEDRRIVNGILFKYEYLNDFWKEQAINTEFILAFKL